MSRLRLRTTAMSMEPGSSVQPYSAAWRTRCATRALAPFAETVGCTYFAALDDQERALAVVLDLVNPAGTRGRTIDCSCELRLDELKKHGTDLAEAKEIAESPLVVTF